MSKDAAELVLDLLPFLSRDVPDDPGRVAWMSSFHTVFCSFGLVSVGIFHFHEGEVADWLLQFHPGWLVLARGVHFT